MRWIVERTLAWISSNRRLARDFENLARTATALVRLALIKIMLRRLQEHELSRQTLKRDEELDDEGVGEVDEER